MSIKSDKWIKDMSEQHKMIEPLTPTQMESFRIQNNGFRLPEKLMEELNATARKAKKKKG